MQEEENELNFWGFVSDKFRRGAISAIFGLLVGAVAYLYFVGQKTNEEILNENKRLQNEVRDCIRRQVEITDRLRAEQITFINKAMEDISRTREQVRKIKKKVDQ